MPRPPRSWITLAVGVVVLMLAAGAAGWTLGHHRGASSTFKFAPGIVYLSPSGGTAYLGANQPLDRSLTGFAYGFPPVMTWNDATGAIHDSGRPACVPYNHAVRVKKMEAVIYPLPDGGATGTVLWVQC